MIASAVLAGSTLLATVVLGVLVHELLHVLVLRTAGVRCSISFDPTLRGERRLRTLVSGSWASVEMESIPATCSPWRLRLAAMAPLAMLLPVGAYAWLVTRGTATGSLTVSMVVVGWMACALPSPADFSVVWHTREVAERVGDVSSGTESG